MILQGNKEYFKNFIDKENILTIYEREMLIDNFDNFKTHYNKNKNDSVKILNNRNISDLIREFNLFDK